MYGVYLSGPIPGQYRRLERVGPGHGMDTKCSTATWWREERRLLNKVAIKNKNKIFLEYHLLPLAFLYMKEWILKFLDPKENNKKAQKLRQL